MYVRQLVIYLHGTDRKRDFYDQGKHFGSKQIKMLKLSQISVLHVGPNYITELEEMNIWKRILWLA